MTGDRTLEHDWYPAAVPDNVEIGDRSWLYSTFAFLHYRSRRPLGVRIGNDSGVYYTSFFDLGPDGEVDIGDFCGIVGCVFSTNGRVEVHDYAFIAHEVVIADSHWATPVRNESVVEPAKHTVVGENAWIGARATILGGVRIGEGAIVGAATVLAEDVPPYTVVGGNPARLVGKVGRR